MSPQERASLAKDYNRFKELNFEGFRQLALAEGLSPFQRIGFPDAYRAGHEATIFADICAKLPALHAENKVVLDIGAGCSELPHMLIDLCQRQGHKLYLSDSAEMLNFLPEGDGIVKVPGYYPNDWSTLLPELRGTVDVVLCYSVLHYIFAEASLYSFLDETLLLLAEGGHFLLGDIPNVSKRKRFFASSSGIACHQEYTGTAEFPKVDFNIPEPGKIDDGVLLGLVARCRAAGFDAYLVPQDPDLPMANRREDLLVVRP